MPSNVVIDKIEVQKSKRELFAYANDKLIKTFTIAIGKNSIGAKQAEGDMKTPEGEYSIAAKKINSAFHRSLLISYPNANDKKLALMLNTAPGGEVEIHGLRNDYAYLKRFQRWKDWTDGCIALTNDEVEDLYNHTPIGTKIIIHP
jgi:murein L,D-transpeptidase YafK